MASSSPNIRMDLGPTPCKASSALELRVVSWAKVVMPSSASALIAGWPIERGNSVAAAVICSVMEQFLHGGQWRTPAEM